ncbi:hypothetical protein N9224_00425 [Akkermansiaceae bacterium]|nr:hypothetical protein [Akkermansiaceae bacterium]
MKFLPLLIIPLVLYVVGLMSGPMIGSMLVKDAKEDTTLQKDIVIGDNVFRVDLAGMRDNELPKVVQIIGQVTLPLKTGDGEKRLATGRKVNLLNRNDKKLIIETMDGLAKGEVEIKQTDIFAVIARGKMDVLNNVATTGQPALGIPAIPVIKPPVVASNDPAPSATPAPAVEPMVPAEPEPEPEPVSVAKLTPERIVEVMKKSIEGGAVKVFTLDQVTDWKAAEDEDIDGVEYQTGLAAYKAQTIFGEQLVQAKALIKDGKVEKWLYAKTGMEIPKGK